MKDPKKQEHRGYVSASDKAATEVMERRSAPRQHFVADVQIIEVASGVRLSARVCDLVLQGCYVDTLRPFPVGTLVRIRLKKGDTTIEPSGKVVYQSPGLGMGIAFHDLAPESQAALEKWVSEAPGQQGTIESFVSSIERDLPPVLLRQPSNELVELIQLLVKKGVLTKAEALGLLKLPLDE
jgi:hypothetical protein